MGRWETRCQRHRRVEQRSLGRRAWHMSRRGHRALLCSSVPYESAFAQLVMPNIHPYVRRRPTTFGDGGGVNMHVVLLPYLPVRSPGDESSGGRRARIQASSIACIRIPDSHQAPPRHTVTPIIGAVRDASTNAPCGSTVRTLGVVGASLRVVSIRVSECFHDLHMYTAAFPLRILTLPVSPGSRRPASPRGTERRSPCQACL